LRATHLIALVVAVLVAVTYFALQSSGWILVAVTDVMFVLGSGACSILAFSAGSRWGFRGKIGIVHSGIFLGVFSWFVSDVAYLIYEVVLRITVSFPSLPQTLFLVSYVAIALGLLQFLWVFRGGLRRIWVLAAVGIGALMFCLGCVLLVGPLVASGVDVFVKAFYVAYPILDLVLFVFALLMVFAFSGGKVTKPWVWISLGLFLRVLSDISLGVGQLQGWYYSGHPIEIIQLCAYIGFALGLDEERRAFLA